MTHLEVMDYIKTKTSLEARPYQSRIVSSVINSFDEKKSSSVLIEAPTGSGKSAMMLMSCRLLQERLGWRIAWAAHRRRLLKQAAAENERIKADIEFISAFATSHPKADLLVVDESQHDAAATFASMHAATGAKRSLGGTATPFRTDRVKLGFETVIRDCSIRSLIEDGYLCKYDHYSIPDFTPAAVAKRLLAEPDRWGKSLVYFQDRRLCHEFKALIGKGLRCETVFGDTSLQRQEDIHCDFGAGKIDVLVNVFMLSEGYDVPSLKTVWVRDSGKLCTLQMAGRVLRKDPANALKTAQIVQSCTARRWPFSKAARPKTEYLLADDSSWRTLLPGPQVSQAIAKTRLLLTKPVALPDFILKASPQKRLVGNSVSGQSRPRRRRQQTGETS